MIGRCEIHTEFGKEIKKFKNIGSRKNVFDHEPDSILIGPNTKFEIICVTNSVDILLPKVKLSGEIASTKPTLIKSDDVQVYDIGEGNFKRKVRVILGGDLRPDGGGPVERRRGHQ